MESKSFPSNFDIAGRYAKPGQTFLITVELKKKLMSKSLNLSLSIFSLIFIIMLVSISNLKYDIAHHFLGAILEITTIPVVLMTIILFVMNLIEWSKEKWSIKKSTFYALIALTLSIVTMIIATIYL